MKTIIETIKENKYFIIITILSILTTVFFATTALFISISDDLTNVVQTKDEEINKLYEGYKKRIECLEEIFQRQL